MNYKEAAKMLVEKGFYHSNLKAWPREHISRAMLQFMDRPMTERLAFLQKEMNSVFDGYSYQGQADSLNQGAEDMVHTFVISEFTEKEVFPSEWQVYLSNEFKSISDQLFQIENELIKQLNLTIKRVDLGHMVSCNFYPAQGEISNKLRLSEHPDVSVFTIFPFGIDDQLEYEENGEWKPLLASNNLVIFSGYLLETLSNGKVKALNHRVKNIEEACQERLSFAFFTIPNNEAKLNVNGNTINATNYFESYLALF